MFADHRKVKRPGVICRRQRPLRCTWGEGHAWDSLDDAKPKHAKAKRTRLQGLQRRRGSVRLHFLDGVSPQLRHLAGLHDWRRSGGCRLRGVQSGKLEARGRRSQSRLGSIEWLGMVGGGWSSCGGSFRIWWRLSSRQQLSASSVPEQACLLSWTALVFSLPNDCPTKEGRSFVASHSPLVLNSLIHRPPIPQPTGVQERLTPCHLSPRRPYPIPLPSPFSFCLRRPNQSKAGSSGFPFRPSRP